MMEHVQDLNLKTAGATGGTMLAHISSVGKHLIIASLEDTQI